MSGKNEVKLTVEVTADWQQIGNPAGAQPAAAAAAQRSQQMVTELQLSNGGSRWGSRWTDDDGIIMMNQNMGTAGYRSAGVNLAHLWVETFGNYQPEILIHYGCSSFR